MSNKINPDDLETGDMLLFSHKNDYHGIVNTFLTLVNNFVGWATDSKYTHSAIVVKNPTFTDHSGHPGHPGHPGYPGYPGYPVPPGLYILESSYENFPDAEDHKYKFGVELEHFNKVIDDWEGEVYVRKLHCKRDEQFYKKLTDAHKVIHDKPYDLNIFDWIDAGLKEDLLKHDPQNTHEFWCSALVTYLYTCWGFLPADTPFTLITCKSLGTEKGDQIKLHFQNCQLDTEVRIK